MSSASAASSLSNVLPSDPNNNNSNRSERSDGTSGADGDNSSPAVVELEGWRAELQRLASDSSSWREWNVSNVYDNMEQELSDEVIMRVKDKLDQKKAVSLSDLKVELAQHEQMLEQIRAEDETLTNVAADLTSLDQLEDELINLVTDLTKSRDKVVQQAAFLRQLDGMTQGTETLTLAETSVERADQLLRGLKLAENLAKRSGEEKKGL